MALPKLSFPPGLDRTGTEYQSQGRWYDSDLVRWFMGYIRPIGGWTALATGLSGTARALHNWVDNSVGGHVAIGTHSNLYVCTPAGTLTDITPVGYSAQASGSVWTMGNTGQLFVGVNDADGTIYKWLPGEALATALEDEAGASGVPSADAIAVTNEGIIVALGAGGNPRNIAWSDRDALEDWSASLLDLAGDLDVSSQGGCLLGRRVPGGLLILTTEDLHIMRFAGLPDVYGIQWVSSDCGGVSRHCMAAVDTQAFWMGKNDFFIFDGNVRAIPCAIHDDVFGQINKSYLHLVQAVHVGEFNEVWFHYPSGAATENNKVAVYNYKEGTWAYHALARSACVSRGSGFDYPLMTDTSGTLWHHESGLTRSGAGTPFARSGPQEIGDGEQIMHVERFIPDEGAAGDCDVYLHARFYPNAAETVYGPFSSANPIPTRLAGRQVAIEYRERVNNDWRVGDYRVKAKARGLR